MTMEQFPLVLAVREAGNLFRRLLFVAPWLSHRIGGQYSKSRFGDSRFLFPLKFAAPRRSCVKKRRSQIFPGKQLHSPPSLALP
jgi:hypothetical protein